MSNKAKTTKTLTPKLRFPEFRDTPACEKKKLSELLFETKQRNRELKYNKNDVLSVSGEHGCVNQIEFMGRSYAGVSVKDYHIVERGDIVYTKSPLKKNPYGIIKENKGKAGIVSTLYAVYRTTKICRPDYLDHYFSVNYNLNSYLQPLVNKGPKNDMKIKNSDVLTGIMFITPNPDEQQKIADCLSSVDELIALEGQKLDALKEHKKGLMQELFPAKDQTLPKRRFPEFKNAPEWEEKKLSRIAVPVSSKYSGTGFNRILTLSGEHGIIDQGDYFGKKIAGNDTTRYTKIELNDFVYNDRTTKLSIYGTIKRLSQYEGGLVSPIYKCFRFDNKENATFWEHYFESGAHEPELSKLVNEGARQGRFNISAKKFLSTRSLSPKPEEQERIANCLSSIDDLITAQSQRVEALKDHKSGLMQQLFPTPEEVIG